LTRCEALNADLMRTLVDDINQTQTPQARTGDN
jgi:hypothetical protein